MQYDMSRAKDLTNGYRMVTTGSRILTYHNETLIYNAQIKNGQLHGMEIQYFNGLPHIVTHYRDGKKDGVRQTYSFYPQHQLHTVEHYKEDQLDGIAETYDRNGELAYAVSFVEGVRQGPAFTYSQGCPTGKSFFWNGHEISRKDAMTLAAMLFAYAENRNVTGSASCTTQDLQQKFAFTG